MRARRMNLPPVQHGLPPSEQSDCGIHNQQNSANQQQSEKAEDVNHVVVHIAGSDRNASAKTRCRICRERSHRATCFSDRSNTTEDAVGPRYSR